MVIDRRIWLPDEALSPSRDHIFRIAFAMTRNSRRFKFAEEPLAVYEDEVKLTLPLRTTPKATQGTISLPISVTVQACDNEKCYPPANLSAAISVEVK